MNRAERSSANSEYSLLAFDLLVIAYAVSDNNYDHHHHVILPVVSAVESAANVFLRSRPLNLVSVIIFTLSKIQL